ncbi:DUF2207 domain-containing protein [Actinomadura nitritigenes]|uniref:DUF2207 domain-containing protein n=1 Tax=Actinomadura nitritigenes TaxID=134602 RepID=UPI0036866092
MRRILLGAAAAACLALLFLAPAASAAPVQERIRSYAVDLAVDRDGVLHVQERIVYDFGGARRHGIERRIRTGRASIGNVRTGSPDAPAGRSVTRSKGAVDVRIGDPSTLVTGVHTYTLDYTAKHAVRSDVLDWNAVGTEWKVPIDVATVLLRAPAAYRSLACYAGPRGSTAPCAGAWNTGQGSAAFGQRLEAEQGITVRAVLPHGAVRPQPSGEGGWRVGALGWLAVPAALLAVAAEVVVFLRPLHWAGMDSAAAVPAAVPAELTVLCTDWAAEAGGADLGASIAVDLAARGHLRISRPADSGPRLRLTGSRDDADLRPYEKAFLDEVFSGGAEAAAEDVDGLGLARRLRPLVEEAVDAHGWRRPWSAGVPLLRFASVLLGVAGVLCLVYGPVAGGAVTDVTAWGAALLVAAPVVWVRSRRIDPFTRRAQQIRDEADRYTGGLVIKDVPDAEDLPFAVARRYAGILRRYVAARGGPPEWYTDDGPEKGLQDRFAEVATVFVDASARKAKRAQGTLPRTLSPTRRTRSGWGGSSHGPIGGFGGDGGGGGVGGGDGGGGGGSW